MKLLMWQQHLTRKHSQTARVATSLQRLAFFVLGPRTIPLFFCPREPLCIPVTNTKLSPVPTPPTHKLPGSIEQAGSTLLSLWAAPWLLGTAAGALWSSLIPLLNKRLDVIYCVDWAIDPSQIISLYNRLCSAPAWWQSAAMGTPSPKQRRLWRAEQQSHLPGLCTDLNSHKQHSQKLQNTNSCLKKKKKKATISQGWQLDEMRGEVFSTVNDSILSVLKTITFRWAGLGTADRQLCSSLLRHWCAIHGHQQLWVQSLHRHHLKMMLELLITISFPRGTTGLCKQFLCKQLQCQFLPSPC